MGFAFIVMRIREVLILSWKVFSKQPEALMKLTDNFLQSQQGFMELPSILLDIIEKISSYIELKLKGKMKEAKCYGDGASAVFEK